jgi:hypothetical protein
MKRLAIAVLLVIGLLSACKTGPKLDTNYQPPDEIQAAFDAALSHVRANYPDQAPAADLQWAGANITPEGLAGSVTYAFEAGDFHVEINHAVVAPEYLQYFVKIDNAKTQFHWEGVVTPDGQVSEAQPTEQP